jgi:hypothetical protein
MLNLPVHSSRFSQNVPLPFHPSMQSHSYPPRISVQSAWRSQSSVSRAHSSISIHVKPSPLNPGRQEQVKLPYVFALWRSFEVGNRKEKHFKDLLKNPFSNRMSITWITQTLVIVLTVSVIVVFCKRPVVLCSRRTIQMGARADRHTS